MSHDHSRLSAAVKRCFAESNNATLKLVAYNALCRAGPTYSRMNFFVVAHHALYNDLVAHAIRILDEHRDVAAFWYIHRCQTNLVETIIRESGSSTLEIRSISEGLRKIREKTHFHVDREAVEAPSEVWRDAGVTGAQIELLLRVAVQVTSGVNVRALGGKALTVTEYDGSDVARIIATLEKSIGSIHGA